MNTERKPAPDFVAVPYTRVTGQSGVVHLLPSAIDAIAETGDNECSVLLANAWLTINLPAAELLDRLAMPGVTPQPKEAP